MTNLTISNRVLLPEPDVQAVIDIFSQGPELHTMSPVGARAAMCAAAPLLYPDMAPVNERRLDIARVPVRAYRPIGTRPSDALPTLLFFHGGGWVMGDLEGYARICADIATKAGTCVLLVDYRLAPEHRFPAAIEDAVAVTEEIFARAAELGVDRERVAVGGDSAGGNIAATLCLLMRNEKLALFRWQLLIYPVTDLRIASDSYRDCGEGYVLGRDTMLWFRSLYLEHQAEMVDWRVSPLLAPDHRGLPPAHVITCGLDPLQDEGRAYADALEKNGVDVTRCHYAGQIHGFLFMGKMIGRYGQAIEEICARLCAALEISR